MSTFVSFLLGGIYRLDLRVREGIIVGTRTHSSFHITNLCTYLVTAKVDKY